MQSQNPFAIFWGTVQFELSISSEQTANQNINNFIDLIFKYQNSQFNDKWNKVKQKLKKKESNNNYILNVIIKEKLLGYVQLLSYLYGKKV